MKRRAILEMVCNLRKNRDFYRKRAKQGAAECNNERDRETACYCAQNYSDARMYAWRYAGMSEMVHQCVGMADAFHISAHKCMELLGR